MNTDALKGERFVPKGMAAKLSAGIRAAFARRPPPPERLSDEGLEAGEEDWTADDVDMHQAWSISARLAAVPMSYLERVPQDVAGLIRQAKDLHPQMAQGAADREARGEPWPPF